MVKSFPLIRSSWSNEKISTALFFVCVLYLIPQWITSPRLILSFLTLMAFALLIDAVLGGFRHHRPVCAVSGGVTAAIFLIVTPGISFLHASIGIVVSLILGKHIQGGTGKNITNPAVIGVLIIGLFTTISAEPVNINVFLLPALLLSLPFAVFRPFAACGYFAGFLIAAVIHPLHVLTIESSANALFWACIIMTDPVTSTPRPIAGFTGGVFIGFLPGFFSHPELTRLLLLSVYNIISRSIEFWDVTTLPRLPVYGKIQKKVVLSADIGSSKLSMRESLQSPEDDVLSVETILERIRNAEVFGMGGGAFPAVQKIEAVMNSVAGRKYFIVNAVECDPGLLHDYWLLRTFPQEINRGIAIVGQCASFTKTVIAIKGQVPSVFLPSCEVQMITSDYPAGAERLLVQKVLGKQLSAEVRPAEKGILVFNVQTILAIYKAVCFKQKADSRFVTIADISKKTAAVVRVGLGTRIDSVAAKTFGSSDGPIFVGGGLMNAVPAISGETTGPKTNFIAKADFPVYKESPHCSRCGWCFSVCPAGLHPGKIAEAWDKSCHVILAKYKLNECLECGSCSVICLAGRDLAGRVREAKRE